MDAIAKSGIEEVKVLTPFNSNHPESMDPLCYGFSLATGQPVEVGEAVGIISAQSIGEPGTQLTMRTFHTGGTSTLIFKEIDDLIDVLSPVKGTVQSITSKNVTIEDTKGELHNIDVVDYSDNFSYLTRYSITKLTNFKVGQKVDKEEFLFKYPKFEIERAKSDFVVKEVNDNPTYVIYEKVTKNADGKKVIKNVTIEPSIGERSNTRPEVLVKEGQDVKKDDIIFARPVGQWETKMLTGAADNLNKTISGLPRIVELFEARTPKGKGIISPITGKIKSIDPTPEGNRNVLIVNEKEEVELLILRRQTMLINQGDTVDAGQSLTTGPKDPKKV